MNTVNDTRCENAVRESIKKKLFSVSVKCGRIDFSTHQILCQSHLCFKDAVFKCTQSVPVFVRVSCVLAVSVLLKSQCLLKHIYLHTSIKTVISLYTGCTQLCVFALTNLLRSSFCALLEI